MRAKWGHLQRPRGRTAWPGGDRRPVVGGGLCAGLGLVLLRVPGLPGQSGNKAASCGDEGVSAGPGCVHCLTLGGVVPK